MLKLCVRFPLLLIIDAKRSVKDEVDDSTSVLTIEESSFNSPSFNSSIFLVVANIGKGLVCLIIVPVFKVRV